jgi:hypothetical protein
MAQDCFVFSAFSFEHRGATSKDKALHLEAYLEEREAELVKWVSAN